MEENLYEVIYEIQKIHRANNFNQKYLKLKTCLDKIVEIVSVMSEKMIGSEELNPIFTFCVIKAKPLNWVSSMKFMNLMISHKDKKGAKGFALTKLAMATNIIELADKTMFKLQNFSMQIL